MTLTRPDIGGTLSPEEHFDDSLHRMRTALTEQERKPIRLTRRGRLILVWIIAIALAVFLGLTSGPT